jgi:hypothetical protein
MCVDQHFGTAPDIRRRTAPARRVAPLLSGGTPPPANIEGHPMDTPIEPDTRGGMSDEGFRTAGIAVVGMSLVLWWPAFTIGAWGIMFFDQMLTVWVAATAALALVLFQPRRRGRR